MTDDAGARPPARSAVRTPVSLVAGLLVLALLGWGAFGPPGSLACGAMTGYADFIVVPIERCASTAQRLGTPVRMSVVGTGCTNYESGGDRGPGTAWGTVPIAGPRGSASYEFLANKTGDTWMVSEGLVTFPDGAKTDVIACVGPGGMADLSNRAMRSLLSQQCAEDNAGICHTLGEALRDGQWGPADPVAARAAFDHACRLGRQASCTARDALP